MLLFWFIVGLVLIGIGSFLVWLFQDPWAELVFGPSEGKVLGVWMILIGFLIAAVFALIFAWRYLP